MRGYFGIGIEHAKTEYNIGTLWRSAQIMGAAFIFTINNRYKKQSSDTMKTFRSIPLVHYKDFADFYEHMPFDCRLIGVELDERAVEIKIFQHPERCIYLLGAEDHGLTKEALNKCHMIVQLPGKFCMNVSVAGSVTMYDRITKRGDK
jgi:tRNA G18 (ribose-2'-O)-methylase SpoU